MNITQGTPEGSAVAVDLRTTWELRTAGSDGARRYRQGFAIALPTGGHAEELVLDTQTALAFRAEDYRFNAVADTAVERATVQRTADGVGLRVTLPVARRIERLTLRAAALPPGATVQIFRTDGDQIGSEPAVSVTPMRRQQRSRRGQTQVAVDRFGISNSQIRESNARSGQTQVALELLDIRFVIRIRTAGGFAPLVAEDLREVRLHTQPENLRVGLRLLDLGTDVFFLPLPAPEGGDAGAALRAQLATLLGRLRDAQTSRTLPDPLRLELVAESDAPCAITFEHFAVRYTLARQSFPDGSAKQVVRADAAATTPTRIALSIPAAATLLEATLTVAGIRGGAMAATAATPSAPTAPVPLPHGLRVDEKHAWVNPVDLPEAMLCAGFDLRLAGLAADSRLRLELLDGPEPESPVLARAQAQLAGPRPVQRLRFEWPAPVLLPAGRRCLVLYCDTGRAVWVLREHAGLRASRLQDSAGGTGPPDCTAIAEPVRSGQQHAPELALNGRALAPALSIDSHPLAPGSDMEPDLAYDLLPALASAPDRGDGYRSAELTVRAAGGGALTIYAPRVRFDLPG